MTPSFEIGKNTPMDQRLKELVNFNITEKAEGRLCAQLTVDSNLPSFKGHFPGHPILPAVSIIDISLFLLENVKDSVSYNTIEVKRSKFMAMVEPNQEIDIEAESDDGTNWRILWRARSNQAKVAQVHLVV